ncbi:3-oxosteroid 1-dehydrogenase [compost metagenome]
MDQNKNPIKGLFSVGNDATSIMGGNYPGAGITLGPALVFGYQTGLFLANNADRNLDHSSSKAVA